MMLKMRENQNREKKKEIKYKDGGVIFGDQKNRLGKMERGKRQNEGEL